MNLTYLITVKQLVPDRELSWDDREDNPAGEYVYDGEDEEQALDEFHANIPIKCLDDFEITCVAKVAEEVWKDIQLMQEASYMHATAHTFKIYAPEPHEYIDEMGPEDPEDNTCEFCGLVPDENDECCDEASTQPEESDMADIRNYGNIRHTENENEWIAFSAIYKGRNVRMVCKLSEVSIVTRDNEVSFDPETVARKLKLIEYEDMY